MKACGLVVEYNPFHHGHLHHVQQAKKISSADCVIAVMSGSFLQRGEPAIIDKFHRAKAALASGVDIVLELPYAFAVQSSELFAKGAVHTLHEIGAETLVFGSESGYIDDFLSSYNMFKTKEDDYNYYLKEAINQGNAFPQASQKAYTRIGMHTSHVDLSLPNNILGFSYLKTILEQQLSIKPLTIKRIKNSYHDQEMSGTISSATSIRKQLLHEQEPLQGPLLDSMPQATIDQLKRYKQIASSWHDWEKYFPFIYYRVLSMTPQELAAIYGIDEGIEHRIIRSIKQATSFDDWVQAIKTKRYTWTRIQRMFVHILTNTKKEELKGINDMDSVPYLRLLGMSTTGQKYLNQRKKDVNIPMISSLKKQLHPLLTIEERASNVYYSIFPPKIRGTLHSQELQPPIFFESVVNN